jgi:hypothetical protein
MCACSEEVRKRILDSIYGIIKLECKSARVLQEHFIEPTTEFPLTDNDTKVADAVSNLFHITLVRLGQRCTAVYKNRRLCASFTEFMDFGRALT